MRLRDLTLVDLWLELPRTESVLWVPGLPVRVTLHCQGRVEILGWAVADRPLRLPPDSPPTWRLRWRDPQRAHRDLTLLLEHLRATTADPGPAQALDEATEVDGAGALVRARVAVAQRRGIPLYPLEALVAGVLTDTVPITVADDHELLVYCCRVAGTVGLLMCGVLDVHHPSALPLAVDLGIGMQLTNICRDVWEHTERGRVYLPADRLLAAGTSPEAVLDGTADPRAITSVVAQLLAIADERYARGEQGLAYLPRRCRFAIRSAARMYRSIGMRLLRSGGSPIMVGRTMVPWHGKVVGLADAALRTLPLPQEEAA